MQSIPAIISDILLVSHLSFQVIEQAIAQSGMESLR